MLRVALQITSTAFSRWTLAPDIAIHAVKQNSSLYEIPDLIDEVAGLLGCLGLSREADLKIIMAAELCLNETTEWFSVENGDVEMMKRPSGDDDTSRSRSPRRQDDNMVMMIEAAEPNLTEGAISTTMRPSAWVGDPKPFGKPERFAGVEKKWTQWRFGMKAYLALCGLMTEPVLVRVGRRSHRVDVNEIERHIDACSAGALEVPRASVREFTRVFTRRSSSDLGVCAH